METKAVYQVPEPFVRNVWHEFSTMRAAYRGAHRNARIYRRTHGQGVSLITRTLNGPYASESVARHVTADGEVW